MEPYNFLLIANQRGNCHLWKQYYNKFVCLWPCVLVLNFDKNMSCKINLVILIPLSIFNPCVNKLLYKLALSQNTSLHLELPCLVYVSKINSRYKILIHLYVYCGVILLYSPSFMFGLRLRRTNTLPLFRRRWVNKFTALIISNYYFTEEAKGHTKTMIDIGFLTVEISTINMKPAWMSPRNMLCEVLIK